MEIKCSEVAFNGSVDLDIAQVLKVEVLKMMQFFKNTSEKLQVGG